MRVLAFKPGHDGAVAVLEGNRLVTSIEGEKDSFHRFSPVTPSSFLDAAELAPGEPDVVAVGGWRKDSLNGARVGAGYNGVEPSRAIQKGHRRYFGRTVRWFSSSHDRSHLYCAYGLSPFPQGRPCYALLWEGDTGAFYRIDERAHVQELGRVLDAPGWRYVLPYQLANPGLSAFEWECESAGKAMALAAFSSDVSPSADESALLEALLDRPVAEVPSKAALSAHPLFNAGVESERCKRQLRLQSDAIFDRFLRFAQAHLREGLPLLLTGGCALNCEWNTRWRRSGLFEDVFIPPCPNDSGSAIGTAIDALREFTGSAKVEWDVYSGGSFIDDAPEVTGWQTASPDRVAGLLADGAIIAWVAGRCEVGPRALGARSILAAPFREATRDRLNRIKKRQAFRPVAPVCLLDELSAHFDECESSPYMLHFCRVVNPRLRAVTHVDGSARVQTLEPRANPPLAALLEAFRRRTGVGVLCNTSLNHPGCGFINRTSELLVFARLVGLDACVVDGRLLTFNVRAPAEDSAVELR
jgi:predicted NodU family carbamoyl transferase